MGVCATHEMNAVANRPTRAGLYDMGEHRMIPGGKHDQEYLICK